MSSGTPRAQGLALHQKGSIGGGGQGKGRNFGTFKCYGSRHSGRGGVEDTLLLREIKEIEKGE